MNFPSKQIIIGIVAIVLVYGGVRLLSGNRNLSDNHSPSASPAIIKLEPQFCTGITIRMLPELKSQNTEHRYSTTGHDTFPVGNPYQQIDVVLENDTGHSIPVSNLVFYGPSTAKLTVHDENVGYADFGPQPQSNFPITQNTWSGSSAQRYMELPTGIARAYTFYWNTTDWKNTKQGGVLTFKDSNTPGCFYAIPLNFTAQDTLVDKQKILTDFQAMK